MKRIYLESITGLIVCFFTSIMLYELLVFELGTDDYSVLELSEAQTFQQLIDGIAIN